MTHDSVFLRIRQKAARLAFSASTRLGWAAMQGDAAEIRAIVAQGVDIDHVAVSKMPQSSDGTALHHAAHCGHVEAVQTLLELGADPNTPNALGYTPLACWFSHACRQVRHGGLDADGLPEDFLRVGVLLVEAGGDWGGNASLQRDVYMDAPTQMARLEHYLTARLENETLQRATTDPAPKRSGGGMRL